MKATDRDRRPMLTFPLYWVFTMTTLGTGTWRWAFLAAVLSTAVGGCGESFQATVGTGGGGTGGAGGSTTSSTTTTASGGTGGVAGSTTGGTAGTGGVPVDCQNGDMQPCYTGPDNTSGVGECKKGTQTCVNNAWGQCEGEVLPATDICDGLDNDCDNVADEDCPCQNGDVQECYEGPGTPGMGPCKKGQAACENGAWQPCEGFVGPQDETCNNFDDNCNGEIDDVQGIGSMCTVAGALGVCQMGKKHCNLDKGALDCFPSVEPSEEICDDLDNDCDGAVDELSLELCTATVSAGGQTVSCQGAFICNNQNLEVCAPMGAIFQDDFSNPANGKWPSLGAEWQIGPAKVTQMLPGQGNPDPTEDHTLTMDNGVAGVVLGGSPINVGPSYMTSKEIDATAYSTLYLSYWRWLNASFDKPHTVEVSTNGGTTWTVIWVNAQNVFDNQWTLTVHSLSSVAGKKFLLRFGYSQPAGGGVSSWNIDDLQIASCPPPGSSAVNP